MFSYFLDEEPALEIVIKEDSGASACESTSTTYDSTKPGCGTSDPSYDGTHVNVDALRKDHMYFDTAKLFYC